MSSLPFGWRLKAIMWPASHKIMPMAHQQLKRHSFSSANIHVIFQSGCKIGHVWPYIAQPMRLVRLLRLSGGNCGRHCSWEDQRTTFSDIFGTGLWFSLQGSTEQGLNWQELDKWLKLSLITLSQSQSLANRSVSSWAHIQIAPALEGFGAAVLSKCPNLYAPSSSVWGSSSGRLLSSSF